MIGVITTRILMSDHGMSFWHSVAVGLVAVILAIVIYSAAMRLRSKLTPNS